MKTRTVETATNPKSLIVEVPENFMNLLEEKNYFGKTKGQFLADAIRLAIDAELSAMAIPEMRRLESKYGLDSLRYSLKCTSIDAEPTLHPSESSIKQGIAHAKRPLSLTLRKRTMTGIPRRDCIIVRVRRAEGRKLRKWLDKFDPLEFATHEEKEIYIFNQRLTEKHREKAQ